MKKRILSVVMAVMMLLSMGATAFADDVEKPELTPKEQVRLNEVIGTAYLGNAIQLFSADGSMATISKGQRIDYANYMTHVFDIATETGTYMGYCAEPSKMPTEGTYAISTLQNDTIKRLLLSGPGGPYYEQLKDSLFWSLPWDVAFADTHACIGYAYTGDTKGMDDQYLDGILNQINAVAGDNAIARMLDSAVDRYTVKVAYNDRAQDIVWLEEAPLGAVELYKSSANPGITDDNACYSLEGAVYQLLDGGGNVVATLTTDINGYARADGITAGSYILKEAAASTGYLLDVNPHEVTIFSGQTATVNVTEEPGNDPMAITLQKVDKDTGETAQATASLAGAQFTIKYYDGYYDINTLPAQATRTWVIETKEITNPQTGEKKYFAYLDNSYKISGDDFYFTGNNPNPILPLGTITIQETKAPDGYLLEGAYLQPAGGGQRVEGIYVSQIRQEGDLVRLDGGNEYTMSDSVIRGGVKIAKWDKELDEKNPQGSASLAGAQIAILNDSDHPVRVNGTSYAKGQTVYTGTTNDKGIMETAADFLPYGRYRYKEVKAPAGYLLSGTLEGSFTITEHGKLVDLTVSFPIKDDIIRGGVKIAKWDRELNSQNPQGGASLSGAQIAIVNDNDNPVRVNGTSYAKGQTVYTGTTNDKGIMETAADLLPYGRYRYKEVKAPAGYLLSGTLEGSFTITEHGKLVDLTVSFPIKDDIIRGGVRIAKWDIESDKREPQGNATLEGAVIGITNTSSHPVLVEGILYRKGETVTTITTNEEGLAETAADLLPYGTYSYEEIQPPLGYLSKGVLSGDFAITRHGVIVDLDNTSHALKNQISRGDLELVKVSDGDMKRMAGVPFQITSAATGESHILVTDENGYLSTSSEWNPHSHNTNQGATALDGVWFGEPAALDDNKGALPYGIYLIEELPCEANENKVLLAPFEVSIRRNNVAVNLGTITNDYAPRPEITTMARDVESGNRMGISDTDVTIIDTVEYRNLTAGEEYTLKGILMDRETKEPLLIEGEKVTQELSFIPKEPCGSVELAFSFDGSTLGKRQVVVFERLYLGAREEAAHTEIFDMYQTVSYEPVEIKTTATDRETGAKEAIADSDVTIIDRVEYKNLAPGKEYTVKGILMDKATEEPLKADGENITAEKTFIPEKENGHIDMEFAFDGRELKGRVTVVFETLYQGDRVAALDGDIHATSQTVSLEGILLTTAAADKETGSREASADADVTITDRVDYINLTPGKEYTLKGILMDKETGEPLKIEGREVMAEKTFTPREADGHVELDFTFDGRGLGGRSVVAFERLYEEEKELAVHTDINDGAQTVDLKEITLDTTAVDKETGTHESRADADVTITDRVDYTGLTPGKEYTVKGILMDKETGEALRIDGKEVTAERTFTPKEADGYVELEFTFDGRQLGQEESKDQQGGRSIVVFETLYEDDLELAVHADIEDADQTVDVIPPEPPVPPVSPETLEPPITSTTPTPPAKPTAPKTGDGFPAMAWMAGLTLSVCVAGYLSYAFKRK